MSKGAVNERVLIAGAGPVGLVTALALARAGIPVTVLEKESGLPTDLRASTFHPPTLDLLDAFPGVTGELVAQGLIASSWQYRDRETGPVVTWDMGLIADHTNHPYRLQTEQWKLTGILHARLSEIPHAEVLFEHEVTGVELRGEHVEIGVDAPDGARVFRGRYAVGAEGANSALRRSLGIDYGGLTFPEQFVTVSTPFEFADHLPGLTYVNYISDPVDWFVLLRVVDNWRVLYPTGLDANRDEVLSDESVQRYLRSVVAANVEFVLAHRTLYNVHQRVAEKYRVGRVLLAGDAAHINNPLGGMGMNGGIQDAFNLSEKLVAVWRGEATEGLLDRYERQRRTMALEFVQASTMANRQLLRESDPIERGRRHQELREIADDPIRAREFLLRSSMITALRESERIR